MLKTCLKCNQKKQCPEDFHKGNKKGDGSHYYHSCKSCFNKYMTEYKLKTGRIKNPHNTPLENLVNQIFGKLTVIQYEGKKKFKNRKKHIWLCQCECGNTKIIEESGLKSGKSKSCGCVRKQVGNNSLNWKGYKDISITFWNSIKNKATERNLEFNITVEYAWELFEKQNHQCSLSGLKLNFSKNSKDRGIASLDRIDSTKGYIEGNVQWLHKHVNIMKLDHKQDYFLKLCNLIINTNLA